jgi:hypothetical protein
MVAPDIGALAPGSARWGRPSSACLDRKALAATLFSGPDYFAAQLGQRKIMDATFLIAAMIHGDPDPEGVRTYHRALRRARHHGLRQLRAIDRVVRRGRSVKPITIPGVARVAPALQSLIACGDVVRRHRMPR